MTHCAKSVTSVNQYLLHGAENTIAEYAVSYAVSLVLFDFVLTRRARSSILC